MLLSDIHNNYEPGVVLADSTTPQPQNAWQGDQLSKLLHESVQPGFEQLSSKIDLNWLIKFG